MQLVLSKKEFLLKWALPIILASVMALLLVVVANGGSSDKVSVGAQQFTDFNPAGESVVVGPPASDTAAGPLPLVLYSLDLGSQATAVASGGGDLLTVTLTNNIAEPIANTAGITQNGDIAGNIVITADIYGPTQVNALTTTIAGTLAAGISTYFTGWGVSQSAQLAEGVAGAAIAQITLTGGSFDTAVNTANSTLQSIGSSYTLPTSNSTGADLIAYGALKASCMGATLGEKADGVMGYTLQATKSVATIGDGGNTSGHGYLICHPGKTFVAQVPVFPLAGPGSVIQYKAVLSYSANSSGTPLL